MLTNLIAAVAITLITNVTTSDNAVWEPDYSTMYAVIPPQYGQRIRTPATERYLTTNVVEHAEIKLTVLGQERVFPVERTLSSVTAILKLKQDWEPAGFRTNSEIATGVLVLTNINIRVPIVDHPEWKIVPN